MTNNLGLIILDGWGVGDKSKSDAIYNSKTPFMDSLMTNYPNATLLTSGKNVGLPENQMGNSEVGHLNIGAGRIVYQELTRINRAIIDKTFFKNKLLINAFQKAEENNLAIHFIGLVSRGGVHSSQDHLYALTEMANDYNIKNSYIHAFTDGRDCDPKSGLLFIKELEKKINNTNTKIASIIGRYFAMDRDNRWGRIKKAYDLMVYGKGEFCDTASKAIELSYAKNITDEFIEPTIINSKGIIKPKDIVICFNFRTDRPRQISIALTQKNLENYKMKKLDIDYYTMTNYDKTFKNINVIFKKDNISQTLGELLSKNNKIQTRIAETEKYPHVTFFFNGGREMEFKGEKRILINSPKVDTYDLKPEMSANEVTEKIIEDINLNKPDFICLNFANPDMVGHTGIYNAIVKAVQTVDKCLKEIVEIGIKNNYEFLIIADHGNADLAINRDGTPNTSHSLNPVPIIHVTKEKNTSIKNGILADIAPTILSRLGIKQPIEMTGKVLI